MDGSDLVGGLVTDTALSVYVDVPSGGRSPMHPYLRINDEWVEFHTIAGVRIRRSEVVEPCEMPELGGRIEVERPAGEPWAGLVGRTITAVARLHPGLGDDGWLLRAGEYEIAVMDVGDELEARRWPYESWGDVRVVESA